MRTQQQRTLNQVQRSEAYREVLVHSAGTRIALSVWEADDPLAPAVVFLPGTMTHPLLYEEFLDALNRAGLTVVGLHPAGHGKSPRLRRSRALTWELLVENAVDAVAWTRELRPEAPVVVLGSSQGGILAMAVAARADGVSAVYAHNVLDPALSASLSVTRAPVWLTPAYRVLRRGLGGLARIAPGVPIPFAAYLQMRRVTPDPEIADFFYTDPIGLRTYPLGLLAGMLGADLPGPARCPVGVLTARGDPLFSLDYTRQVFDRIEAPEKELVVIECDRHLLLTEAPEDVLPVLLPRLEALRRTPPA